MRLSYFYPLLGFVIPTLVVAYGFVIPRSCIAGWNEQSIGFATTLLGASATYWMGLRRVVKAAKNDEDGPGAAS